MQAQADTLQHSTEAQRLTVRAEGAEAEASRSQQECQRLHSEYDHKVRSFYTLISLMSYSATQTTLVE